MECLLVSYLPSQIPVSRRVLVHLQAHLLPSQTSGERLAERRLSQLEFSASAVAAFYRWRFMTKPESSTQDLKTGVHNVVLSGLDGRYGDVHALVLSLSAVPVGVG